MQLDTLFAQLHNLPNVPEVAQVLIRQFDDPNTSIETLSRTVARDPVIAAKVLRLANSARFRGARESTSIEDAALRLGFNTLRTLVLASAFAGGFKAAPGFDLQSFWYNSFLVASLCKPLAKQAGLDQETAFTCGMLHDIGELLIQSGAPELAPSLAGRATASSHRAADETLQLGFGYPEVGAELARRWQLPQVLRDAIGYQARPLQAPEGNGYALIVAQAVARGRGAARECRRQQGAGPERPAVRQHRPGTADGRAAQRPGYRRDLCPGRLIPGGPGQIAGKKKPLELGSQGFSQIWR